MAALRRRRSRDAETFRKELAWREFSYHLLFHRPNLPLGDFRPEFDAFEWRSAPSALKAWQRGQTGYPIVDAGMRELWQTGWMHNRVAMIAASFLIKDLLIDWRKGEEWFWDPLVTRTRRKSGELAVGGGIRRRCGAILPNLQPGVAGRKIRSWKATMSALCARLASFRSLCPSALGCAGVVSRGEPPGTREGLPVTNGGACAGEGPRDGGIPRH